MNKKQLVVAWFRKYLPFLAKRNQEGIDAKILELPKKKNIIDFTNRETHIWLKTYVQHWGMRNAATSEHYEIIKTELMRRNNESMFWLTIVNIFLSFAILSLALATFYKKQ